MKMITNSQIESLFYSAHKSFMNEQYNRFEFYETKDSTDWSKSKTIRNKRKENLIKNFPDNKCVMYFYSSKLEALISFNYYNKKHKAVLCWDLDAVDIKGKYPDDGWCVVVYDSKNLIVVD